MEINCLFNIGNIISKNLYTCLIDEVIIDKKDHVIKAFKGDHKRGKSHTDVQCVQFRSRSVNYFPQGLHKHFPNMTKLIIFRGGIKEITKNDLEGLEGLVGLYIERCQFTSLPNDLFTKMPSLREISFSNKIEFASSEFLRPLLGRQYVRVDLCTNKSIDAKFWPGQEGSLDSLRELMRLIDKKCSKPTLTVIPNPVNFSPKIKEMWKTGKLSDLTIIAGEKKFKVHKTILGIKSSSFAQIFEDQKEAAEVNIPDFSAKSVEALLKFIYLNEVTADENFKENFEIAVKFKVFGMKSSYEKIIYNQLNDLNSLEIFFFAHRYSSQLLKRTAFNIISKQQAAKEIPVELPDHLMEDPEKLRQLIYHREAYEAILINSKALSLSPN